MRTLGQESGRVVGRVTDADTDVPIAGAVLVLSAPDGALVTTLSSQTGAFVLVAPRAGRYVLRAQMIGREDAVTDTLDVPTGSDVAVDIAMRPRPVQLAAIDVGGDRQCRVAQEVGRATDLVWREARTALRAQIVTRQMSLYEFDLLSFERVLDRGDRVMEAREDTLHTVHNDPFSSLPPEDLAEDGYARDEDGGIFLYAPNTDALLSDGFLSTHCFRLRRSDDRPGHIGLAFEPVSGRRETDIEGVLWLDEATSELRALEFSYRSLPRALMRGDYTGEAEFRRLPSGGWIIERWMLRSPMREDGQDYTRARGGEVLAVRVPSARTNPEVFVARVGDTVQLAASMDSASSDSARLSPSR